MLGDIVVIIIAALIFIDILLMCVYCRIKVWDERRSNKKMYQKCSSTVASDNASAVNVKPRGIKKFIRFLMDNYIYGLMRYSLLVVGKLPSGHLRNWLYRFVFNTKITKRTVISGGSEIRSPWNFHADNCRISNNCILDCRNEIFIGQNVVLGGGVHIWTEEHSVNDPNFAVLPENRGAVVIDNRAWICSDSTILPGVHVGEGAVLASRACATKDLDPYGIYAGIPARKIGERNHDLTYNLNGKAHWHFY